LNNKHASNVLTASNPLTLKIINSLKYV